MGLVPVGFGIEGRRAAGRAEVDRAAVLIALCGGGCRVDGHAAHRIGRGWLAWLVVVGRDFDAGLDTDGPGGRHGGRVPAVQPVGVTDDGQRAERHRGGGEHRRQPDAEQRVEHAGGDRDADAVVDQGEEQVLADVAHGGPGQLYGGGDSGQRAGDEGDVGGFDGDVGAGTDGQSDVGRGEGGCVVDAVADHAHAAAFSLQAADFVGFTVGEYLGDGAVDADLGGDGRGRAVVVAGEHDDVDAEVVQGGDRGGGVGFDGVGDTEDAGGPAVDGGQNGGLALGGQFIGGGREGGGADAQLGQQPGGTGDDGVTVDGRLDALASDRGEADGGRRGEPPLPGTGDDRGREGVFAVRFGGRDQP